MRIEKFKCYFCKTLKFVTITIKLNSETNGKVFSYSKNNLIQSILIQMNAFFIVLQKYFQ